ncbi:site-specific DNA-methyltransferase [Albidovulum sediminicola]|uniref:site-specific DNA-methyltransferase (adenine-specific) n=1 Tax=Albidovulum sediminicola TaxID=2984331 RepID=A0ABT2Z706_9RHOB|nr:DNA methyltransferase [Defluviimonas sp. WL0075]MCV2866830.1 site-specific DNA-methyltransferase [Defluviimonas sp. WL0075]
MGVTFINKPNSKPTGTASQAPENHGSKPTAANTATPAPAGGGRRNDLLPGLTIETWPVASLVGARNPVRKPSKKQVARACRSIQRLGFRVPPLVCADGEIIDGHARIEAARQLGLERVPCIVVKDLTPDQIRLLRLAVNRLQERGEWDEQALKLEFAYLLEFEPDLVVTGFEAPEIDRILVLDDGGPEETDPLDEIGDLPAPDASAVTRPGDTWQLGVHRVHCGNARSPEDLASLVDGRKVVAVFTDPPYNVRVNGHVRVGKGKFAEFAEASGEMSEAAYEDFLRITIGNTAKVVDPGGVLYLCIDWRHAEVLMRVLRELGLELLNLCVWVKDRPGMGSLYRSQHELVLVAKKPGAPHRNNVQLGAHGRNRSTVWRYAGATGGRKAQEDDFSLHPTVKPVRLVRDTFLDVTAMDDVVLDPFLGSGTTALAAERARRACVGLEISPAYVDVAVGRWEEMTGLEAIHEATGLTFAQMRQARHTPDAGGGAGRAGRAEPRTGSAGLEEF